MSVDERMTARSVGSGDVEVLASPSLITLVEQTAVRFIRPHFPPELTTVGTSVELKHEAATAERGHIEVEVWLEPGTDRRLRFAFKASDGMGTVARGTHERVIVDRSRFLDAAEERRAAADAKQKRGLPE
jgi:predicted thioesterase